MEAEVPRARVNSKNLTTREKLEHEGSGHAVHRSWFTACVEGRGVGGQHRIELLEEGERNYDSHCCRRFRFQQENAGMFTILRCRDNICGQMGPRCYKRKGPTE